LISPDVLCIRNFFLQIIFLQVFIGKLFNQSVSYLYSINSKLKKNRTFVSELPEEIRQGLVNRKLKKTER
jgi:hypothetical protein